MAVDVSSLPFRSRSQARMLALQALCCFDALGDAFAPQLEEFLRDEQVLEDLDIERPPPAALLALARGLADGAWARRPRYDELLNRNVPQWTVSRMTPVDRNVLRLGLYELLDADETPVQVVLNEAIELARRFGDTNSPGFVNGVLDAIRRSVASENAAPSEPPAPPEPTAPSGGPPAGADAAAPQE